MTTAQLRHEARILKMGYARGDFLRGDDGYWVWWPTGNHGCYGEHDLLTVAKILHDANRKYDKELTEYFHSQREQGFPDF